MSRRTIVLLVLIALCAMETSGMLTGLCMGQYCFGHRMYLPANRPVNSKRSAEWMNMPGAWLNREQFGELRRYVSST